MPTSSRFVMRRHHGRWYVDDTSFGVINPRIIAGLGQDHRPSDAASLTQAEATAIMQVLNALHAEQSAG